MIDKVIRSKRRTVSLEVTRDAKVIVRAPLRAPESLINDFIRQKQRWILRKKEDALRKQKQLIPKSFEEGEEFFYLGQSCPLSISESQAPLSFDGTFQLSGNHKDRARIVFIKWYRRQAKAKIGERLEYYSSAHSISYNSFRISGASRRWGSCGHKNTLNFSWRLIMAPLPVLDYVVVHELAHVVEKNHSRRFWTKVGEMMPEHRQHRKWLKENEYKLSL